MNDAKLYEVIRAPRVSEKTASLQEVSNQYAFEVSRDATKADIKAAVEKLFDVKVEAVNVVNVKGKNKSFRFRTGRDRKSTRLNSSHVRISYAVFCLKKKIRLLVHQLGRSCE